MSTFTDTRQRLKALVTSGRTLLVPGAPNALAGRLVEEAGFEAAYATGAGIANTFLGVPDIGLLSLQEMAQHVAAMTNVIGIPLIVDADTGFGNAVNVWHTVRTLERAGASAIQLEDQTFPKRCGHFDGKSVVPAEEMAAKVRAAVDARSDPNLMIMARTDARSTDGLEEACRRARLYRAAGADILFIEAPESEDEIRHIARTVEGPKVLNIVEGGKTPALSLDRAAELGFAIVLYANLPLVVSMHAVSGFLASLKANGHAEGGPPRATFQQRQALVRKDVFDDMSRRYSA